MSEILNAPEPILQFLLKSSQLYFKGKMLVFVPEDLDKLLKLLPEVWWNKNDKLIYFTYYADGSYYCEREKTVYNYSIKDYTKIPYEFNVLSNIEAREVYVAMCKFFEDIRLEQLKSQKESLRKELTKEFDFITIDFLGQRRKLLELSDWSQLTDVLLTMNENEKNMWVKYRKYLRDMTDLDSWKNFEYIDVVFPKDPTNILEKYPELTSDEYLTSENHFDYIITTAINSKIQNFLYSVMLLTTTECSEEIKTLVKDPNSTSVQDYKKVLSNINERLFKIDPSFKMSIKIAINDTHYVMNEDSINKVDNVVYGDSVEIIDALIEENI